MSLGCKKIGTQTTKANVKDRNKSHELVFIAIRTVLNLSSPA